MRLLLEGPAIEPLLARVRAEHGPTARIVNAERVRSGGVGGFFAKEHFEVTVEVDDDTPTPTPARDHAEVPAPAPAPTPEPNPTRDSAEVTGLDALVAAAEQAERDDVPPHRPISTESTAFDSVLKALRTASALPDEPATPPQPAPFVPRAIRREDLPPTAPDVVPPVDNTTSRQAADPQQAASFHDRLSAAGLPTNLLDTLAPEAGPTELLAVLRRLPTAPALPAQAGRLVVVVGEGREATEAARRVADRLRLNSEGEGFTAPVSTDEARQVSAGVRAGMVPGVVVVESGLDRQSLDRTVQMLRALSPDQVIACVDATRKTADTRAWLDAWCRPGVRVDALSVYNGALTTDPATVLGLDTPVTEVDGLPGSATTWLALLLDRIER
jgi:hypothetical protein